MHPSDQKSQSNGSWSSGRHVRETFRDGTQFQHLGTVRSPETRASDSWILRFEAMKDEQMRVIIFIVRSTTLAGVILLLTEFILALRKAESFFLETLWIPIQNCVLASFLLIILGFLGISYGFRLVSVRNRNLHWSRKRKRMAIFTSILCATQGLQLIFLLIPNAFMLAKGVCYSFHYLIVWSGAVRWSCVNTIFLIFIVQAHDCNLWIHGPPGKTLPVDATLSDAPLYFHWRGALLWLIFEGCIIALGINVTVGNEVGPLPPKPGQSGCTTGAADCSFGGAALGLTITVFAMLLSYLFAWICFIVTALHDLHGRPYQLFRSTNILVRIYKRSRSWAVLFFIISLILLFFARINTCSAFATVWKGLAPVELVMTMVICVSAYIFMPIDPNVEKPILWTNLQEFAWTEAEKPQKMADRNQKLQSLIEREPMFCFETALKLWYFSCLAYVVAEAHPMDIKLNVSLETALTLYQLQQYRIIWEKKSDTKCLIAWNSSRVVLSFRGTASVTNVLMDLQVWPSRIQEAISPARVHTGFSKSWRANGLDERVVECVRAIVRGDEESGQRSERVRVLLTALSRTRDCCTRTPSRWYIATVPYR
eukprot:jgi/Botrbrau1/9198/Bobra.0236s0025.1